MQHAYRGSPLGGETVVALGDDGLDVTDGTTRHIALSDIVRVRLRMTPLRASTDQFICEVEPRDGARLAICSASYSGPLTIENRADTWRPLVDQLHQRLAKRQPPPQFVAGDPPARIALPIVAWLALVAAALWAFSQGHAMGLPALLPIGFFGVFYWYRRLHPNRPRPYDPLSPPPRLMPGAQTR